MSQAQGWKARRPAAAAWGLSCLLGLLVSAAPLGRPAWAQEARAPDADARSVEQATALNRQAIDSYERGDFDEARAALRRALLICSAAGLDKHPICARAMLNMGVVLVGGLGQRATGIAQFRKALQLAPDITISNSLASPEVASAFAEAARRAPDAEAGSDPAAASPLMHHAVGQGKRGSAISISVAVQTALKFEKLILAYRAAGTSEFLGRPLRPAGSGSYTAEIPSLATAGDHVAYFIEALDKDGEVLAARGSVEDPIIIALVGGAAAPSGRDEAEESTEVDPGTRKMFAAFTLGSGVGVASGNGDLNADVMSGGAQLALARVMHLSPEVGLWLNRSLLLSVQARLQLVAGTTDLIANGHRYRAAGRAAALFARASWLFRRKARLHPLFSLALGAGAIRHVVSFPYSDCGADGKQRCVDSITAGPFLAGAGSGFLLELDDRWFFLVQLNVQTAAPHSTLNLDANVGAAARF